MSLANKKFEMKILSMSTADEKILVRGRKSISRKSVFLNYWLSNVASDNKTVMTIELIK